MNEKTTYSWKPGFHVRASTDEAMKVCEALRNGAGLSPQNLLEVSRPEGTALHDEFEWNDSIAAEKFRLIRAGNIIRSIVVVHESPKESGGQEPKAIEVRAFFPTHNKDEDSRDTYESLAVINRDDTMRTRLMNDCLRELQWVQKKYRTLKEITDSLDIPINALKKSIEKQGKEIGA